MILCIINIDLSQTVYHENTDIKYAEEEKKISLTKIIIKESHSIDIYWCNLLK